ncbi:hypothetical protein ELQ87_25675 [Streptomyces griseoviridis]|uniref:DUF4194 domain-containing protein n=1 Tax=Streptomyces griseoviridis TaxID=45398 RepID=A0A3Q9KQQ9_STRGD|nr:hypothetical protein [Streptomyces griseoviridis]AZS87246.1 hypothetical protein ELQ87_25675 [Streptomyces griseoviridis]QCN85901.1 hypothetical protein DDJ31_13590 [Streptomyces griseoviridis]
MPHPDDIPLTDSFPIPLDLASATELRQVLDDELAKARISARVDVLQFGTVLEIVFLGSGKLPFDSDPVQAGIWLAKHSVDGRARFTPEQDLAVTLTTVTAVHQVVAAIADPHTLMYAAAAALDDALSAYPLPAETRVHSDHVVMLLLHDSLELGTAAGFARLLGGQDPDAGLDLNRPRGVRRLAERIGWLATGVTGSRVLVDGIPGCGHAPDHLALYLTAEQARRVTERIEAGDRHAHASTQESTS